VADTRKRVESGADPVPPKLQAAPPVSDEPTIAEAMGLAPTEWARHEACMRSDVGRDFGRMMDRFTRWNNRPFAAHADAKKCPPALREPAAAVARQMAARWSELAQELDTPTRLEAVK